MKAISTRRNFIKNTSTILGVLAIGLKSSDANSTDLEPVKLNLVFGQLEFNPYILMDSTGQITLFNPRPDMGQGTWQSLPMLLAEELEVSLDQVSIKQTDGQGKYGGQLSGGSSSVTSRWLPMRKAGAAIKEMLVSTAAKKWNVSTEECYAKLAKVYHKPSGKSYLYSELVDEAAKLDVPKSPKLKDAKDFTLIGKSIPRPEIPSKVNGKAIFGIDVEIPNMLYASVEHCPVIDGKIISIDDSETLKVSGVIKVLRSERAMPHKTVETVAVIASNYWAALKGRKALKVKWDTTEFGAVSTNQYFEELAKMATEPAYDYPDKNGDFDKTYVNSPKKLTAQYQTPFLAHAPLEPENAVAHFMGDSVEVWGPFQGPDGVINELANYLKIKKDKIKVNVTFLGGAFGRKAYLDFLKEAVHLSKLMNAPVKVLWTREDDMTQGPFRPGMLNVLEAGINETGKVEALHHKILGESLQGQIFKANLNNKPDNWAEETVSKEDSPLQIPNIKRSFKQNKTTIPVLWWRSVYSSTNAFGHESFIDELAHATQKDPVTFRKEMFSESPRFMKVLETLAEKSEWFTQKLPLTQAKGIAIARSFGTICGHVVTVEQTKEGIKVKKVVSVIDCGIAVNPDNVKAQTEGNIIMGLTAAIKSGITFENGRSMQQNYDTYQVLRMNESPTMEIHIIENTEAPSGVGEPGLPPIAPALSNAIFKLTGKRQRNLPLSMV